MPEQITMPSGSGNTPSPLQEKKRGQRSLIMWALGGLAFLMVLVILSDVYPQNLRGALFQLAPGGTSPVTGVFISRGYEAQPNERGSVVLQAAETLTDLEALKLTFVVDPVQASLVRVRRTAATQTFAISLSYPAEGVVQVALVGAPRTVSAATHLLEFELQLKDSSVNSTGDRIDLRLLNVEYSTQGLQLGTVAHDGLLTFITSQNALILPYTPHIADVDPGIFPLVGAMPISIRGKSLPPSPRVLLGNQPIPVQSASSTEIIATIPEDTPAGVYSVSVESLLAQEDVVVLNTVGVSGSVDILKDLMFFSPNPALHPGGAGGVVLWVPVFNPLGPDDPIIGSVDLSPIGGDPNVIFRGTGTPSVGPGGTMVNWFRIPESGDFPLTDTLQTNVDYSIPVRVENRNLSVDTESEVLQLRSQVSQGNAPSFGIVETVPSSPQPGDDVSFYVDVSHPEGIEALSLVSLRLTSIGGGVEDLSPVLSGVPLTTTAFTVDFTIPENTIPGTYPLELQAVDQDGDLVTMTYQFLVSPPGGQNQGSPPVFGPRVEARPSATGPGAEMSFFAEVADPEGTNTIQSVTIDLIDIGGSTVQMEATEDPDIVGTLPVVYQADFQLPSSLADGAYLLPVRAIDRNGLSATTYITLVVDASLGGGGAGGSAPVFSGRLEALPSVVSLEGSTTFYVGVGDPDGTDTIEQVTMDLVDIKGGILELEPTVDAVRGSVQPVVYTGEYSLPSTVLPGVYNLEVRAIDSEGNATSTTVPLTVTAVGQPTGAPAILQVFATPDTVPADDDTDVFFTVEVEDTDGLDDIAVARINLTPIDLPVISLDLDTSTSADNGRRGFFVSDKIQVPRTVESGSYDLLIEVEDEQGARASQNVRLNVGTGSFGGEAPVFLESRFIPETARPGGDVRLFIEMQDLNSADEDDLTVIADFTELRLEATELDAIINYPSGTFITRNTFATGTLHLPDDLPVGIYDIPVTAIDDTNNIVHATVRLRVEKGGERTGQAPRIDATRAFQEPRVFPNDGSSDGEIHVLVSDVDDDVVTVIANLGGIGRATSASIPNTVNGIDLFCNESRAIVCMKPSVLESTTSRWFVLDSLAIPATTVASDEPYYIDITAIDEEGNTDTARIPVLVGNAEDVSQLGAAPEFTLIVPVDDHSLELLVSPPVATNSVERDGSQFIMHPALNAGTTFGVNRVSWDTSAHILYLQTDALQSGETYIFSANADGFTTPPLTDIYGNRFGGSVTFSAYDGTRETPAIEDVRVIDPETIEVLFSTLVLPSSVHPDVLATKATLTSVVTNERKKIRNGALQADGRTLRLTVDRLREGDRYLLRIPGVIAPGLIEVPAPGAEKTFVAIFPRGAAEDNTPLILPTADLNKDGRVDFADFALFSSVYNTEYSLEDISSLHNAAAPEGGEASSQNNLGGDLPSLNF